MNSENMVQNETLFFNYTAFGFNITSHLALPELREGLNKVLPQVQIRFSKVPESLENPIFKGVRFQVSLNSFLLKVDGIARYHIQNGNLIEIEIDEKASEDEIRLFLLGSAFGALFQQAGYLPIHGSALSFKNKAIIISGISGAGKSTLATSLYKMGYPILTDDICTVSLNDQQKPMVYPGYPQMKLWADSLEKLGEEKTALKKVRQSLQKYYLPLPKHQNEAPAELAGIYVIVTKNTPGFNLEQVKGIEKFNLIKNNTYRLNFLKDTKAIESHFMHTNAIAKNCFVKRVERPSKGFHLADLSQLLEADFTKLLNV